MTPTVADKTQSESISWDYTSVVDFIYFRRLMEEALYGSYLTIFQSAYINATFWIGLNIFLLIICNVFYLFTHILPTQLKPWLACRHTQYRKP